MGKYDVDRKCSEIRKLVRDKKYEEALEILKTIDIMHVKNVLDYKVFYEVFSSLKMYEDAKEMLIRMYQRNSSKRVLYQLVCLAVRSGKLDEAEECYDDYLKKAPNCEDRYILRYLIDKAKHADIKVRIETLEELKKYNYYEEWAYELAKLYHKAGRKEDCMKECRNIIVWFGEGVIVEKARMLLKYYEEGDRSFMDKVEAWKKASGKRKQETKPEVVSEEKEKSCAAFDTGKSEEKERIEITFDLKKQIEEMKRKVREEKPEPIKVSLPEEVVNEVKKVIEEEQQKEQEKEEKLPAEDVIVKGINLSKQFASYFEKNTLKMQIILCFRDIQNETENPILYVTAEDVSGSLEFVKQTAKTLKELSILKKSQVAKINGENLNHIKLTEKKDNLRDSVLFIQNASSLYLPTVQEIMKLSEELKGELVIIFEDSEENIKIFREEHYELKNDNSYIINL